MKKNSKSPTMATLQVALARAAELHIRHIVVASTGGDTALGLAKQLPNDVEAVCVTHHAGFSEFGKNELADSVENRLAEHGIPVLRTTHLFAGVERAIRLKVGGLGPAETIAFTYRTLGEGTKVGVEIAVMALDAGLIPYGKDVVAIAGTGSGADTALVIRPAHSRQFFETRVKEIICKPTDW
ncbi:MAG TPA: pyruvate kinase alpha/beta domain-containing protein [bacterium]|nr:pyruvate kinase alpha/beta domain-containing protein [bacterium]